MENTRTGSDPVFKLLLALLIIGLWGLLLRPLLLPRPVEAQGNKTAPSAQGYTVAFMNGRPTFVVAGNGCISSWDIDPVGKLIRNDVQSLPAK